MHDSSVVLDGSIVINLHHYYGETAREIMMWLTISLMVLLAVVVLWVFVDSTNDDGDDGFY